MKNLSVVIVTWNAKKYVAECLGSLRAILRNPGAEILVVDNQSLDGTPEFVSDNYPSVVLIRNQANLGFAKANNIGIEKSTGTYLALINSDVRVLDGCIDKMLAYMETHPQVGMLGPRMLDAQGRPSRSYMREPTLWRFFCRAVALDRLFPKSALFGGYAANHLNYDRIASADVLNGWFWMIRKQALEKAGLLDETFFMYGEDMDWCKRFRDAGWEIVYYPEAESIHYGGASSSRQPIRFSVEMQKANFQYWQKHFSRFSQMAYLSIVCVHQIIRVFGYGALMLWRTRRSDAAFKVRRSLACLSWIVGFQYDGKKGKP